MTQLRGSSQEKCGWGIIRFDYKKAANDKREPDRVGSEVYVKIKPTREICEAKLPSKKGVGWIGRQAVVVASLSS